MSRVSPAVFHSCEDDWPVLLHMVISVRRKQRTTAWLRFTDTLPPNPPEDRVRVDFVSDAYDRSPEGLLKVMESMVAQMRRQLALKEAIKE